MSDPLPLWMLLFCGSTMILAGHRFNPNKLLLDPYAKQLVGELRWGPELFGYELGHPDKDLSFDQP